MTLKLKAEVKQRWLQALRGGEYEQGTCALKEPGHGVSKDTFCCLGVLADIAAKEGLGEWDEFGTWSPRGSGGLEDSCLPLEVANWAFDASDGPLADSKYDPEVFYKPEGEILTLSFLNDGGGQFGSLSFVEIANLIEEQL